MRRRQPYRREPQRCPHGNAAFICTICTTLIGGNAPRPSFNEGDRVVVVAPWSRLGIDLEQQVGVVQRRDTMSHDGVYVKVQFDVLARRLEGDRYGTDYVPARALVLAEEAT